MNVALRPLCVFFCVLLPLGLGAQSGRASSRFFEVIASYCRFTHQAVYNQQNLEAIQQQQYAQLVPVGPRASERLFRDSRFFSVGDSGVYYYAYQQGYGNFHQLVLCWKGPYSPALILMTYSDTGRLLSEISLAGNFRDGGDYFVWNSHFLNDATLIFNYNSYYEQERKRFYCDSTLTTYSIRTDGFVRPVAHQSFTVLTERIRGRHVEVVDSQRQLCRIFAPSGLKLRQTLNKHSKTQVIPYGTEVEVLRTTRSPYTIDWIQGNWAFVRIDSLEGYMFDGYLSTFPTPEIEQPKSCRDDFAGLLREYAAGYLQAAGKWDTLHLATEAGDSLRIHARLHLQDSLRLEVFRFDTLEVTDLHLPESNVEEAFILLQAILTPCNDTDLLDDKILFVKNRAGRIHKIYDREGRVEITEGKRNQIRIRMRTILREGKEN